MTVVEETGEYGGAVQVVAAPRPAVPPVGLAVPAVAAGGVPAGTAVAAGGVQAGGVTATLKSSQKS